MGSEAIAFPGLLLAVILLITSEVTAKELADRTSTSMENIESEVAEKTNGVEEAKYPGGGYRRFPRGGYGPGDGYRGFPGSGYGSYPSGGFGRYPGASGFGGNRGGGYGNRGGCYGGGYCPYRY